MAYFSVSISEQPLKEQESNVSQDIVYLYSPEQP